jgi:acetylglutamate kinase
MTRKASANEATGAVAVSDISSVDKAHILAEALPYMQRYGEETVVIKYGGHAMGDARLAELFAQDVSLLRQSGVRPVVVHGGGPQIGDMLKRLGIQSKFAAGLRITDKPTVEVVEMVLAGSINKQIVTAINRAGGRAVGLSGTDGSLIVARKLQRTVIDPDSNIERIIDLGFVGEPETVTPDILEDLADSDIIPVVAPVGVGRDGITYNINADTAAGAVASALGAKRLLMLTDVTGVLDADGKLVEALTSAEARRMMDSGAISGGMIPKVETCLAAVAAGVEAAVILDGRVPHAVLLELYTDHGVGTMIT